MEGVEGGDLTDFDEPNSKSHWKEKISVQPAAAQLQGQS